MTLRSVLVEVDTYNPITEQTETLRLCNSKNPADAVHNGNQYMAVVDGSVSLVDDLFGLAAGGEAGSTVGTIVLNNRSQRLDDWLQNQWADQAVRILSAPAGSAYSSYVTEFTGIARNPSATWNQVSLTVGSILERARVPLCKDSYTGGGSAEGPTTLRNVRKPVALGKVINVEPIPVDPANLIYQWHGHGPTQGVTAVYSSGNPLGASIGNVADYAALVALTVPPGRYAACNAEGLIKIGAPIQKLTLDGEGCNDGGRANTHGDIIRRMLTKYAGFSAGDVDGTSLTALNTAVPGDAQLWAQSDVNVLDIVIDMMASLHGYVKAAPDGSVEFGLIRYGASSVDLSANALTQDTNFSRLPIQQPFHKTELGYARVWSVHSDTEVVEVDPGTTLFRWTGAGTVPTNTNAAGGLKFYFNSPVAGPAILMVEAFDAEGGVYLDLNGTELGPLTYNDNAAALFEIPTDAMIVGENEVSVYASNADDAVVYSLEVARDYLSQTLSEITVSGVRPLAAGPENFFPGYIGGQGNLQFTTDDTLSGATAVGEFRHLDGTSYSIATDLRVTLPADADGVYYIMFSAQNVQDETGSGRFQALGARGDHENFILVRDGDSTMQAVDQLGNTLDFTALATDAVVFGLRVSAGEIVQTHSFMALLGNDGAVGADGSSYAEKLIYQRAATQPATPTGGSYDFGPGTLTPPTGWSAGIPGGSGPVWTSITSAAVVGTTGVDDSLSWSTPVKAFQDGGTGIDGQAVDIVFIRAASQPATPAPSSGVPTGYYATAAEVPAGSGRIYGAFGKRPTSSDPYTWDEPTIVEAEDGAPGADGADGADGDAAQIEYGQSDLGPWDSTFDPGDTHIRSRVGTGDWQGPFRIKGVDGALPFGFKLNSSWAAAGAGEAFIHGFVDGEAADVDGFYWWEGQKVTIPRAISGQIYTVFTGAAGKKGYVCHSQGSAFFQIGGVDQFVAFVFNERNQWCFDNNTTTPVAFTPTQDHIAIGTLSTGAADVITGGGPISPVTLVSVGILSQVDQLLYEHAGRREIYNTQTILVDVVQDSTGDVFNSVIEIRGDGSSLAPEPIVSIETPKGWDDQGNGTAISNDVGEITFTLLLSNGTNSTHTVVSPTLFASALSPNSVFNPLLPDAPRFLLVGYNQAITDFVAQHSYRPTQARVTGLNKAGVINAQEIFFEFIESR